VNSAAEHLDWNFLVSKQSGPERDGLGIPVKALDTPIVGFNTNHKAARRLPLEYLL